MIKRNMELNNFRETINEFKRKVDKIYKYSTKDDTMEAINFKSKEIVMNAYQLKPNLNYDIEGKLIQKDGKKIGIEKQIDGNKVYYSIRLKKEVEGEIGQNIKINSDNILSYEVHKPKEESNLKIEDMISSLGVENSEETKEAIKALMENGIEISEDTIDSYLNSKKYLEKIVSDIDIDSIIKLLDMDIDIMKEPLHKIADVLSQIKEKGSFSLSSIFKLSRKLSYKEAEVIAKNIYGRKMGKDVYDAIIALHRENININKENIERILEVINKLYDLKDSQSEVFIQALDENINITIEELYKIKHSYKITTLDMNVNSSNYEEFTVISEMDYEDILKKLNEINIEVNSENVTLAREFLLNEVELTGANFQRVIDMKNTLKQLTELLDKESIAMLMKEGIDPVKEDIFKLVEDVKEFKDKTQDFNSLNVDDILKNLQEIKEITDKELLFLIKSGQDFKLENLKNIIDTQMSIADGLSKETLEKAVNISNIFNTLGNLDTNTISFALKRYSSISLNNLYESCLKLADSMTLKVEPVDEARENLIRQEYLNIKKNTTINLIKESIKDGVSIEDMPLEELNEYISRKNNRYKEASDILKDIESIKGKEEASVLISLKRNSNMNLKEIKNSRQYLEFSSSFDTSSHSDNNKNSSNFKSKYNISKDDLVVKIPVTLGNEFSNVNLIIPNMKKGIDKDNMKFYLTMTTEKLGNLDFSLKVKGGSIYFECEADNKMKIMDNIGYLKERFTSIGYDLKSIPSKD